MKNIWLLFVSSLIIGCSHTWLDSKPLEHSFDDVWNTTYATLVRERYDIIRASEKTREIETAWKLNLSMWYLKGHRNKVNIKIEDYQPPEQEAELEEPGAEPVEVPEAPKPKYILKIQVIKEQNRAIDNPAAEEEAVWVSDGNNAREEQKLQTTIIGALEFKRVTDKMYQTTEKK